MLHNFDRSGCLVRLSAWHGRMVALLILYGACTHAAHVWTGSGSCWLCCLPLAVQVCPRVPPHACGHVQGIVQPSTRGFDWHPRLTVSLNGRQREPITAYIMYDSEAQGSHVGKNQVGFDVMLPLRREVRLLLGPRHATAAAEGAVASPRQFPCTWREDGPFDLFGTMVLSFCCTACCLSAAPAQCCSDWCR